MVRVNLIINNPLFKKYLSDIDEFEKQRIYCNHGFDHLINTARIAYILSLEENIKIDKEIIYAAALLHDIGRANEYRFGRNHDIESGVISREIMEESNFDEDEIDMVVSAITSHRSEDNLAGDLGVILYKADKTSRECYSCKAEDTCKWTSEKKNMQIKY